MYILQLTDVNEVFAFYNHRKQLEKCSHIAFLRRKWEVISAVSEVYLAFEYELFELVILEAVHKYLLIDSEAFVVEKKDSP